MKRIRLFILAVVCIIAPIGIVTANDGTEAKPITPKALQEDLQTLLATIERVHPDIYAYTTKHVFKQRMDAVLQRLDHSMTPLEFHRLVAPLVSALKSGHTYVALPGWAEHLKIDGRFYPIDIYWHGEEVILAHYYGPQPLPLGGTIVSINGWPATELLLQLSLYFSAEGQEGNRFELERPALLQQTLWSEFQTADLRLEIRDLEGRTRQSRIHPITLERGAKEKMPHHDEGLFSCRFLTGCQAAVLRIESFGLKHRSEFERFLVKTFTEIRERRVTKVIIDLRDNGGGASSGVRALLACLTERDIVLQEDESALARAFSTSRVQDLPRFGGRVFVLIGKRTNSAAVGCAAAIQHYRLGTLVGEETAEHMQFFGESRKFTLPHSGLIYVVASDRTVLIGGKGQVGGLIPDYKVELSRLDTAKGVDAVLEFTLRLIQDEDRGTQRNRSAPHPLSRK
jgi:C-terminal processing protease CtpA/Prc